MESGPEVRKLDYSKKTENKLTVLLRVLKLFGCRYPGPSLMIVGGLLLAGLAEIFGVLTLLPLLSLVTGEIGGTRSGVEAVILDIVNRQLCSHARRTALVRLPRWYPHKPPSPPMVNIS